MKALSHDMTWANANIWNYGMKSPDDIPSKSLNPMKLERSRHLEFANASQGSLQPMSAMMWTST